MALKRRRHDAVEMLRPLWRSSGLMKSNPPVNPVRRPIVIVDVVKRPAFGGDASPLMLLQRAMATAFAELALKCKNQVLLGSSLFVLLQAVILCETERRFELFGTSELLFGTSELLCRNSWPN
jgi:hypothetical protein